MAWRLAVVLALSPTLLATASPPPESCESDREDSSLLQTRSLSSKETAEEVKKSWKFKYDHRKCHDTFTPMTCDTLHGFKTTFTCDKPKMPMRELYRATYKLYRRAKWAELESVFTENECNRGYPPCNGGYDWRYQPLVAGQTYDRYVSDTYNYATVGTQKVPLIPGAFTSPCDGTFASCQSFGARALYGNESSYLYYVHIEVIKNLTALNSSLTAMSSTVIPWYGQPGLGIQTYFNLPNIGQYTISWNALTGLLDDETSDNGAPYFKVSIVSSPSGSGTCVGCDLSATPAYTLES